MREDRGRGKEGGGREEGSRGEGEGGERERERKGGKEREREGWWRDQSNLPVLRGGGEISPTFQY